MTSLQPTVFLDIDGVICPNLPYGGMHVYRALCRPEDAAPDLYERLFAAEAIEVLRELVKQFKPRFVLTTSWLALLDRHHFVYVFGRCGLGQVAGSLHEHWDAPANRGVTRFEAIKRWLEQHHHGEAFLVLDDVESGESLRGTSLETAARVVLCDVDDCLRRSHLEAARSALRRPIYHAATNLAPTKLLQVSDENRLELHFEQRSVEDRRDGEASVVGAANFEPNEREREIIKQAIQNAEKANPSGHHAPDELVARMTAEGSFVESPPRFDHASTEFRLVLAAAIEEPLTSRELEERLQAPTCTSAAVFKAPRHVVLLEFSQQAATFDAAMKDAVKNVLRAFPQADFLDLNDQNALLEELVDAIEGRSPTEAQLRRMLHSRVPSNDTMALAAAAAGAFSAIASGRATHGQEQVVEAVVFEMLTGFGLVHLMTEGGTMLSLAESTPGIASLQAVREGQRYRCWVGGRFDVVVRAELIS